MSNKRKLDKIVNDGASHHDVDQDLIEEMMDYCASSDLTLAGLKQKLQSYPGLVKAKSKRKRRTGRTLLHQLCFSDAVSFDIVKYFVSVYPEAAKIKATGDDSALPLHFACFSNCPRSVIDFLIESYPMALRKKWTVHGTPLHCFIKRSTDQRVIRMQNNSVSYRYIYEPHDPDLESIKHLIQLYPEGLNCVDNRNRTPLHTACTYIPSCSLELVKMLAGDSITIFSRGSGRTETVLPIHCCFFGRFCPTLEAIRYLINSAPGTVGRPGANGATAVHLACRCKAVTTDVLKLFVSVRPNCFALIDDENYVPLHYLFQNFKIQLIRLRKSSCQDNVSLI